MKMKRNLYQRALLLTGLVLLSASLKAQEAKSSETYSDTKHSVILNQLLVAKGFTNKAVEMMIVDFPPMSRSPSHRHPCPTFGYVISGEIVSVFEGKTYHYKAGDSFYETPNGLHSDARNDSKTATAKLLVVYIKDRAKPEFVIAH
jgi:quercetin dioxygenase-like cupin family protein